MESSKIKQVVYPRAQALENIGIKDLNEDEVAWRRRRKIKKNKLNDKMAHKTGLPNALLH